MTDLKRRLITGIATGALLLNGFTPLVFADTTITVSGNGSESNNSVNVTMTQTQNVIQNNSANITNNVDVDAKTGDNEAEGNTGGDVKVETGNAVVNTTINNTANSNYADVDCCETGNTTVLVKNNGSESENEVELNQTSNTTVWQNNTANVTNDVDVYAETGDNDANDNTGGDVKVDTGDAKVYTNLDTKANANSAVVGSNGGSGDLTLKILGNGEDSDNDIVLDVVRSVVVGQTNDAYVDNDVDADAKTGDNEAEDNTGGNAEIETGDAVVNTTVDNLLNFNQADVDCGGCLFGDVEASVDGNGEDSENEIEATLAFNEGEKDGTFQTNDADVDNDLYDLDADTGDNDVEDNTAQGDGDPSVDSGDAKVETNISNTANLNGVGDDSSFEMPDLGQITITLDVHELLALLGLAV